MKVATIFVSFGILSVCDAGGFRNPLKRKMHRIEALEKYNINLDFDHKIHFQNFAAVPEKSLPTEFNWCGVHNHCAPSYNQHIPQYCGSCFLHAAIATVADRIMVKQGDTRSPIMLSRQSFLSCAPQFGFSQGCDGGETFDVWEYMKKNSQFGGGLPDETCQCYRADDHTKFGGKKCPGTAFCMNCMPNEKGESECWPVEKPIMYTVEDYGKIPSDEASIRKEIHANGPVACGIASYDDFDYNYRGGIWTKGANQTDVDHDVEIVGWGEENGLKYWIIRNSWGSFWGMNGFFKIPRGVNHMQIESDCWYVNPNYEDLKKVENGEYHGSMHGLVK